MQLHTEGEPDQLMEARGWKTCTMLLCCWGTMKAVWAGCWGMLNPRGALEGRPEGHLATSMRMQNKPTLQHIGHVSKFAC